jgi:hypothetical protein
VGNEAGWYTGGMNATPTTLDVTGLPPAVVSDLQRLVDTLRAGSVSPRSPIGGRLEHLNLPTPSLEEFTRARQELWADVPQPFPAPTEGDG